MTISYMLTLFNVNVGYGRIGGKMAGVMDVVIQERRHENYIMKVSANL